MPQGALHRRRQWIACQCWVKYSLRHRRVLSLHQYTRSGPRFPEVNIWAETKQPRHDQSTEQPSQFHWTSVIAARLLKYVFVTSTAQSAFGYKFWGHSEQKRIDRFVKAGLDPKYLQRVDIVEIKRDDERKRGRQWRVRWDWEWAICWRQREKTWLRWRTPRGSCIAKLNQSWWKHRERPSGRLWEIWTNR